MFKLILLYLTIIGAFSQARYGSSLGTIFNDDGCCDHDEIEVSGQGSVFGQPDVARIRVSFEATGDTSRDAVANLAAKVNSFILVLESNGVNAQDYEANTISVFNNWVGGQIVGQKASQSFTITVKNLDQTGNKVAVLIDQIAVINTIQIQSVSFDIFDKSPLQEQARTRAYEDAKQKAEDYAEAAGVFVGRVITIEDGEFDSSPPVQFAKAEAFSVRSDSAPTQIAVGEQEVSYRTKITFAIRFGF